MELNNEVLSQHRILAFHEPLIGFLLDVVINLARDLHYDRKQSWAQNEKHLVKNELKSLYKIVIMLIY